MTCSHRGQNGTNAEDNDNSTEQHHGHSGGRLINSSASTAARARAYNKRKLGFEDLNERGDKTRGIAAAKATWQQGLRSAGGLGLQYRAGNSPPCIRTLQDHVGAGESANDLDLEIGPPVAVHVAHQGAVGIAHLTCLAGEVR